MFLKHKKLLLLYLIITLTFFINLTVISASKSPNLDKLSDDKFKLHISQGRIHYLRRHFRNAIKKWQPLIEHKAFTDNLRNWLNKAYGKVLTAYGHYNNAYALYLKLDLYKAENVCLEALDIYPNYREAIELLKLIRAAMIVETNLLTARKCIKNKEYEKAILICKKILKIQPDNVAALELIEEALSRKNNIKLDKEIKQISARGISSFSNKEYELAQVTFNNILKMDKNNPTAIKYINKIEQINKEKEEKIILNEETKKYYSGGIKLYKSGDYTNAKKEFQNATALISNYKKAIQYLEKVENKIIEQDKIKKKEEEKLISKYLSQGITYYYKKKYKMSIAMLEQAQLLDPDNIFATEYIKKAKDFLYQKGSKYISEDSPYYPLFLTIKRKANYYFNIGDYIESLKWWDKILKLFPLNKISRDMATVIALKLDKDRAADFLSLRYNEGENFFNNEKYKNALEEFKMIYKIDPEYKDVKEYIEKTEKYLKKPPVIRLSRKVLKNYYEAGLKYFKGKNYNNAIIEWEKILKDTSLDNPYRVNAIVNISKLKRKIAFSISIAKKEKPKPDKQNKTVRKHYLKGIAFYIKGKYKKAINEWQLVLKYEPNHAKAKNNIEKCERKLQFAR